MSARTRSAGKARLRIAILLSALPLLAGCQSWRASTVAPITVLTEERPEVVRVTLSDGEVVTLAQPRLVSDTIVGASEAGLERAAVGEVRTLEVRRTSFTRTFGLVLTHAAAVVTAIVLIVDAQPHYRGF